MDLGKTIPKFKLTDQNGSFLDSNDFLGSPLVIFFYPKDFTPGCTAQACSFRDNMDMFIENGIKVIGISSDSEKSHSNFASKYNLDYPILSDKGGRLKRKFGVKTTLMGLLPGRETFVFNDKGELVHKYSSLNPSGHLKSVKNFLKI